MKNSNDDFGMALETNQLIYVIGALRETESDIRWRLPKEYDYFDMIYHILFRRKLYKV